ncbi:MAG: hypothetical protein EOM25_11800 [Deltaproteobacteria bacterium]|nr:hypothetical protein [Deltaproteobacteria bacterium]
MKQRLTVGVFSILSIILFLFVSPVFSLAFSGGDGSPGNPYQIQYLSELQSVGGHVDKHFLLMNNIDASDTLFWNDGKGFLPIFNFSGSFNGQGFEIGGLYINRPNIPNCVGLFTTLQSGAQVTNLKLVSGSVTGYSSVGFLVGTNHGGRISNCNATGRVSGHDRVGGLVGSMSAGSVKTSHSTGDVDGDTNFVGGLVGQILGGTLNKNYATGKVIGGGNSVGGLVGVNNGVIDNCFSIGNVNGTSSVGGLVGYNNSDGIVRYCYTISGIVQGTNKLGGLVGDNFEGEIINSFSFCEARGDFDIGGLVGSNRYGSVKRSYARGKVLAIDPEFPAPEYDYIGGLVGNNSGDVMECYATGYIYTYVLSHEEAIGGLVGYNTGTVSMSYWDKQSTGRTTSQGSVPSFGKNTAQMKQQATFVGWDFARTWSIQETLAYPFLLARQSTAFLPAIHLLLLGE